MPPSERARRVKSVPGKRRVGLCGGLSTAGWSCSGAWRSHSSRSRWRSPSRA